MTATTTNAAPRTTSGNQVVSINEGKALRGIKYNVSLPLYRNTIDKAIEMAREYRTSKCELFRHMIEFASRNNQFLEIMRQLYGSDSK